MVLFVLSYSKIRALVKFSDIQRHGTRLCHRSSQHCVLVVLKVWNCAEHILLLEEFRPMLPRWKWQRLHHIITATLQTKLLECPEDAQGASVD